MRWHVKAGEMGLINDQLKIFGERNTATNALKVLIETNSKTRVSPSVAKELDTSFRWKMRLLGRLPKMFRARATEAYIDSVFRGRSPKFAWKHTATRFQDISCLEGSACALTIRNPISWLFGLHRRPYNALATTPAEFSSFLNWPWELCRRDNLEDKKLTPPEIWNQKARYLVDFAEQAERRNIETVAIKFEDFVVDQDAVFARIKHLLVEPADRPSIVQSSTKDRTKDHNYYRDYYTQEKWLSEIEPTCVQSAGQRVDWGLAGIFGYNRPSL